METYTIKEGQWNFKPRESWLPQFNVNSLLIEGVFFSSCYYSFDSWEFDRDWFDLNKVKGLTRYCNLNDRDSCMLAWRPGNIVDTIALFAYVNYPGKERKTEHLATISVKRKYKCLVTFVDDSARFELIYNNIKFVKSLPFKHFKVYREIGTSFGGKNNSIGKYGGKATKDMAMQLSLTLNPDGVT